VVNIDNFTEEEQKILAPYFTNLNKPVYAFTGRVPEEVVAVLFSKYSRSTDSLRKNFLKLVKDPDSGFQEILNTVGAGKEAGFTSALEKARDFFQRILVGYGDDSVGELGIAHVACENVSNIATKRLEDARLTSPLEKSTRYVVYDKTMFLREPRIMSSEFAKEYVAVNELLLNTYAEQIEPTKNYVRKQWPIEEFDLFGKKISEITDERELKRSRT
jgi:thymidylate synthase ThyX